MLALGMKLQGDEVERRKRNAKYASRFWEQIRNEPENLKEKYKF